jgi:hypothetical protein
MSVVFARTRHSYDSYSDFWRLVALCGYETVFVDEIDWYRTAAYIFTPLNGEAQEKLASQPEDRRATIIWWFLERLDGTPMLQDGSFEKIRPLVDAVWVSDRWTATRHPAFKYVCIASHPCLGYDPLPATYDFTHQSYVWGRREAVIRQLVAAGLSEGPNAWGDERTEVLRRSRCMLNVQQYDLPVYAPLRFALAAAFSMALVSETMQDPFPLDANLVEMVPYNELVSTTIRVAENPGDRGARLFQALCVDRTFRSEVEAAL